MSRSLSAGFRIAVSAAALGAAPAPAIALPPVPLAGQGLHVALYARQGAAPDVKGLERRLHRIARLLGQGTVPRVKFFHYEHAEDVAAATGIYAGGVTFPGLGQIHSTSYRADHEMVHILAFGLGRPGAFFQEGLAVALGDRGRYSDGRRVDDVVRERGQRETLAASIAGFDAGDPREGYAVAGSFVGDLIRRHGLAGVVRFFNATSSAGTHEAFAAALAETLEQAERAWLLRLFGAAPRGPALASAHGPLRLAPAGGR